MYSSKRGRFYRGGFLITIFEDNKDAALSLFFQKAYPDNIASSFIYANGNGNLIAVAKEYLEKTNDMIGIFLDCVPGNNNIGRIYERLRFLSVQNHYRLLIFPVICTEYYFLDSLVSLGIIKRTNDIELCLSRGLFQNADLMKNGMFKNKTRNFEKYCKNLIIYSGLPCMPEKKYCNIACICKENLPDCPSITVEKKKFKFCFKISCCAG